MLRRSRKKPRYEVILRDGFKFFFKYEEDVPDLLHIWARHLKTPDDAIRIWFCRGEVENEARQRFETYTLKEGIHWIWLDKEDKTVLIISCFDK